MVQQVCSFPNAKHDDYCVDEMSLVTMADGSLKPIKYVQVGEQVMTPNGARRVTAIHDNGIKEVWEISTRTSNLLATANHEVMTQDGWKRVDTLAQGCDSVENLLCVKQFVKSFVARLVNQQNQDLDLVRQVHNTHTMRHVYDLTVEEEHCYYANGLLVHNCDALSQGLRVLRDMGFIEIDPPREYDYDDERPKRENPYAM
jgi:hypothetical protein